LFLYGKCASCYGLHQLYVRDLHGTKITQIGVARMFAAAGDALFLTSNPDDLFQLSGVHSYPLGLRVHLQLTISNNPYNFISCPDGASVSTAPSDYAYDYTISSPVPEDFIVIPTRPRPVSFLSPPIPAELSFHRHRFPQEFQSVPTRSRKNNKHFQH